MWLTAKLKFMQENRIRNTQTCTVSAQKRRFAVDKRLVFYSRRDKTDVLKCNLTKQLHIVHI